MRTKLVFLSVVLVAMAWAAPAAAKGVSEGVIEGEGLDAPIVVVGAEGGGPSSEHLVGDLGIYELLFEGGSRATPTAPDGALGPRFVIRWNLMGPNGDNELVQELYPYAEGGPVSHVAGGQSFFGSEETTDRWLRNPSRVVDQLLELGLPTQGALAGGGSGTRWAPIGASLGAVLLLGIGLALFGRRPREEVAPAAG